MVFRELSRSDPAATRFATISSLWIFHVGVFARVCIPICACDDCLESKKLLAKNIPLFCLRHLCFVDFRQLGL